MDQLRITLAQLNATVGDIDGNGAKLLSAWQKAKDEQADLVIASELFLTGYPPEDLVLKPSLSGKIETAIKSLAAATAHGPAMVVGTPWRENNRLYNAALLLDGGNIVDKTYKYDLPNYACFDEKRVFTAGPLPKPVQWRGLSLGILICEDIWTPAVTAHLRDNGAQILLVPNGSPYQINKQTRRYDVTRARISETGLPLVYVNQYGGQDELLYDGASFVLDAAGELRVQMEAWTESLLTTHWSIDNGKIQPQSGPIADIPQNGAAIYTALVTGLRDYVIKNKFAKVLLGLSGGIDSALVAAIAVDALGADNVYAVMMPSPYTSPESLRDAAACAKALGCRLDTIPITPAMAAFDEALKPRFTGTPSGIAEENIQARCRGIIMMALSNKFGGMLLTTGNKSEMAVGYSTLYGDMCGGYAPLKDVYKTEVYRISLWRNANKPPHALGPSVPVIPENILAKAPTAELRHDQKDQDSLPPYDTLDAILACLIENDLGIAETIAQGHDAETVARVWQMLDRAEYKRRQAPPGPKITVRHISRDRRYPITNGYAEKRGN